MPSPQVRLADVLITDELPFRPARPNTYDSVTKALIGLSTEVAKNPADVFKKLAEYALELCRADSAGISILEHHPDGGRFRWYAIAGAFAAYAGQTMALESPCGMVVETDKPALFRRPESFFSYLVPVSLPMEEALLVPFRVEEKPRGTLWAISHRTDVRFDATDLTILSDLSQFASSAYQILVRLGYLDK